MPVTLSDLCGIRPELREAELQRRVQEEIRQPFDLARDLMIRVRAFRMEEDDWGLTVVLHHIASDFWSWRVLCRELRHSMKDYGRCSKARLRNWRFNIEISRAGSRNGCKGPIQKPSWLLANESGWRTRTIGTAVCTSAPVGAVISTAHVNSWPCRRSCTGNWRILSRREEATLFMTLLAGFVALLSRYTKREDLVIGSPAAGRCRAELEDLIGFFANIMVLRTSLNGDPTFRELLGRTREVVLDALAHQEVPFAKLVHELRPARSASHLPFFQIVFMLQQDLAASFRLPGVTAPTSKWIPASPNSI